MNTEEQLNLMAGSLLAMQEAFVRLSEIVRDHLTDAGAADYVTGEVDELIEGVKAL